MVTSDDIFIDESDAAPVWFFKILTIKSSALPLLTMSLLDPVTLGFRRKRFGRGGASRKNGMTAYCEREPAALSGGQKQKLAVASVLAMHPKIIILDESTVMLDPASRRAHDLILKLKEKKQYDRAHYASHGRSAPSRPCLYLGRRQNCA